MKTLNPNLPIYISGDNLTVENIMPANNRHFSLQELYALINTDIVEVVYLYDDTIMIIDEEGKIKDEPVINKLASQLFSVDRMNETEMKEWLKKSEEIGFTVIGFSDSDLGLPHNSICGNAIICKSKYFQ